ncbi:hypothetical protein JHK86_049167 [Glycine max]|nr:hypothetical protein JHK86_049167 [Glycine max]
MHLSHHIPCHHSLIPRPSSIFSYPPPSNPLLSSHLPRPSPRSSLLLPPPSTLIDAYHNNLSLTPSPSPRNLYGNHSFSLNFEFMSNPIGDLTTQTKLSPHHSNAFLSSIICEVEIMFINPKNTINTNLRWVVIEGEQRWWVVGGDWLPVTMEELLQIASNNDMQDNVEVHKEES